RSAAGLILLQNRSFVTGMPVADMASHELNARTESDRSLVHARLSRRGGRLQTAAHRGDAPSSARQPHARGARPRAAADIPAALITIALSSPSRSTARWQHRDDGL